MSKPKTRLYIDGVLESGREMSLRKDHIHFLANVLRLKSGDVIALFNANDGEWSAILENFSKRQGIARIEKQRRGPDPEHGPWLVFAPVKKKRTDFIIEKATELGVEQLIPVITKFTATSHLNVERLRVIATEAAEQCGRLSTPEISEPCSLIELVGNWPKGRRLIVGDEKGGGVSLVQALSTADECSEHGFLVGPEGGFDDDELEFMEGHDFCQTVDLGPRILRAETAAVASLSVWNALTGR